jgi:hypothetical protein
MSWPCFLIEMARPHTEYVVSCSAKHRVVVEALDDVAFDAAPPEPSAGWPTTCSVCGEVLNFDGDFDDGWRSRQGGYIWRRPDTGEEHRHQHEFGAGAMFDVSGWSAHEGPDGRALGVVTPPGGNGDLWLIDGPASSGGFWTRTGEPPHLTVTPSILTPNYHGFLQDGVLTDSLPDRPLDA